MIKYHFLYYLNFLVTFLFIHFYLLFLSISKSCVKKWEIKRSKKISCCFIFLFFSSLVKRPGADASFICFPGDLILSSQFLRDQQFARMILFFFSFSSCFFFLSFTMLSFLYRSWIELVFEDSFRCSLIPQATKNFQTCGEQLVRLLRYRW